MPDLLWFLLLLVANAVLAFFLQRRAYNRGYDAGLDDALQFGRYVDEVLQGDAPRKPQPPTHPPTNP